MLGCEVFAFDTGIFNRKQISIDMLAQPIEKFECSLGRGKHSAKITT